MHIYFGRIGRDDPDIIYHTGAGVPSCDRALLHYRLGCAIWDGAKMKEKSLLDELEARGYDLSTLRFSIRKKATNPTQEADK